VAKILPRTWFGTSECFATLGAALRAKLGIPSLLACNFTAKIDSFSSKSMPPTIAVDIPQFLFQLLPRCYPAQFCEAFGTKGKPAISLRQRALFWLREPDLN
jgi:hypothetical protein